MKKLLIGLLSINALLFALLTAQSVQSAPKTYDAVKLANYTMCINAWANFDIAILRSNGGAVNIKPSTYPKYCNSLKP